MKKGSHVPFYHELTMNGQIKSCFCILGNMLFAFFPVIRTKTGFPLIRFISILNNTKPASIFLNLEFLLRIEFRQVHFLCWWKCVWFWCWKFTDITQLCPAFQYLKRKSENNNSKKKTKIEAGKTLYISLTQRRLICALVVYSKPCCLTKESIIKPRLSRPFSIPTVCCVNMLIRVLFMVECGNY